MRDFGSILRIMENSSKSWSLNEMKRMLDIGLVSVFDVDNEGRNGLHHALLWQHWPIVRLFISYGADVNNENNNSISPFIDAWTRRFRCEEIPGDILEDWDKLFLQDRSQMDVFGFSNLHKAYLGLSGLTFGQVLADTDRSCVDNIDSLGRTVLYWAANRGDSHTVVQLLAMGADPNKQNKLGHTPLHIAVYVDVKTSEILLDAKADPKIQDILGQSALHCIGQNSKSLIKRIVELGADIDKVNKYNVTALHYACLEERLDVMRELLACGADINVCDYQGHNPVFTVVWLNCHQILSTLLSTPSVELGVIDSSGYDIFMFAAAYGDIQTLKILSDEWPAWIDLEGRNVEEALRLAQCRRDENADWRQKFSMPPDNDPVAWFNAFEEMVKTLVKRQVITHEPEHSAHRDEG